MITNPILDEKYRVQKEMNSNSNNDLKKYIEFTRKIALAAKKKYKLKLNRIKKIKKPPNNRMGLTRRSFFLDKVTMNNNVSLVPGVFSRRAAQLIRIVGHIKI